MPILYDVSDIRLYSAGRWQVWPQSSRLPGARQDHFFLVYTLGKRIVGETLEALKELNQSGMVSSGKACQPLIAEASRRTGLSEKQVKVSQMIVEVCSTFPSPSIRFVPKISSYTLFTPAQSAREMLPSSY